MHEDDELARCARADFPALHQQVNGRPLIYFDNGATTHKPAQVIDAVADFYRRDNANVHRGLHALSTRATEAFEGARAKAAAFFHAGSPDNIVFTRGATEAVNLVAAAWGGANLRPGDTVAVTEMEHHSNLVPWQLACERAGAAIRWVPVRDRSGHIATDDVVKILESGVKLFAFTHISNSLGVVNPAAEWCALARERGVLTLLDAAQSCGHAPVDVRAIGCDFMVCSGHKMCAPTGIGLLYGRPEALEAMPPYHGGGEMIETADFGRSTYKAPPHRFEAGTPNIGGAVGIGAAMDYLEKTGRAKIEAHDRALAQYARDRIVDDGLGEVLGPERGRAGLVSFEMPGVHAHDLVTFADTRGIALRGGHHCTQPLMRKLGLTATARASFYFYNTATEVDRFIEVLHEARTYFA